ncbi:hypothetical protein Ahy_B10g101993 [Arachis hypogaea]|uniref:Transposase Tnp1/En/Spm-like domain-containing protein n=1 Tax=Arachis hypogaea TaxID=3818 RepID=A0A444X161_ARAHY|nr:hypothetical protein Ahy_B10g101993 [Arachis hypogaea]
MFLSFVYYCFLYRFVRMPRKPRYNIIREPPKDARTNAGTEETTVGSTTRGAQTSQEQPRDRAPPISSSANRAPTTRMNEPFRAPRIDHRNAQSSIADDPQTPTDNIETRHRAEVADHELGDEDYDPEADEVLSFDDYINDLFATQEVEGQYNNKKSKDTNFWEVTIIGKYFFPPIFFPIHLHSWKLVSKAKREHAYGMLKKREQGRPVVRGELFIMTHKKKDGSYIHPDARVVSEAIANVERQDGSSKHLSQNDSLAQVLGKEHPRRVRALGAGPCPTQVFGNAAGQPSGSAESNAKDKRMIAELTAKIEEERVKRQSIHKVLGYVVQQLGGNLPVEIAEELAFVGSTLDSSCAGPSSSGYHDSQQKF